MLRKNYKRSYGRKRYARKRSTKVATKSYVKKVVAENIETKYYESGFGMPSVGTGWTLNSNMVSNISIGTGITNRIGQKIRLTGLAWKGLIVGGQSNSVADESYNQFRVALMRTENTFSASSLSAVTLLMPITKVNTTDLRSVMLDKIYLLQSPAKNSTGFMPATKQVSGYKKLNIPVTFKSGSVLADSELNFGFISDSSGIPNPGISGGWLKLYFKDA